MIVWHVIFAFDLNLTHTMKRKSILILSACLFYALPASAQNPDQQSSNNTKFYYFKEPSLLIDNRDSADFTRIISPDTSNSKLFIVEDVYRNGKTKMKAKSLTQGPYFKGQGPGVEYYPDGVIKETKTYDKGHVIGLRIEYYPNGKPKETVDYYDNGSTKNWTEYYPNGKLYYVSDYDTVAKLGHVREVRDSMGKVTAQNGNGTYAVYNTDYKDVMLEGPIVNGLKDGEWKGSWNDSTKINCIYSKGVSVSGTTRLKSGEVIHFTKDEVEPQFKGGNEAFYRELAKHVRYPKAAKENNIQGKVILSFFVEKDGTITTIKVWRGIGWGCDDEAVKALKQTSQPWIPGSQYGLPVRVAYTIPLTFSLQMD
jgi:TonB family protein